MAEYPSHRPLDALANRGDAMKVVKKAEKGGKTRDLREFDNMGRTPVPVQGETPDTKEIQNARAFKQDCDDKG